MDGVAVCTSKAKNVRKWKELVLASSDDFWDNSGVKDELHEAFCCWVGHQGKQIKQRRTIFSLIFPVSEDQLSFILQGSAFHKHVL